MILFLLFTFNIVLGNYYFNDGRLNQLGSGFDYLTYIEKENVFILDSVNIAPPEDKISTINLPTGIIMKNAPETNYGYGAKVINHNTDITDIRDIEFHTRGSYRSLAGSFSLDSETTKEYLTSSNVRVTSVKSKFQMARFFAQFGELNMTTGFINIVNDIGNSLEKNTTMSRLQALIATDNLLTRFGTSVIAEITEGGIIEKKDSVSISSRTGDVDKWLSASASGHFGKYFDISTRYTTEHEDIESYVENILATNIKTLGGKPWKMNYTYNDWIDTVISEPYTIGMRIVDIIDVIDTQHFPHFDENLIFAIKIMIANRTQVYLKNNEYKGCSNVDSPNYLKYANIVDDNLCDFNYTYHFGGIYTTSNNEDFSYTNILTNDYSCPEGYESFNLLNLQFQGEQHANTICHHEKKHFWSHKKKKCHTEYTYSSVSTSTYICMSQANRTDGVHFGGAYSDTVENDIIGEKGCPDRYISYPIYHNYDKNVAVTYICIAPYDIGKVINYEFGGFISSQAPNFYVGNKPVCGDGFERHPIGPNPQSELTYCIKTGTLHNNKIKRVIPPGYGNKLTIIKELYELSSNENGTKIGIEVDPKNETQYQYQAGLTAINTFYDDNGTFTSNNVTGSALYKWFVEHADVDTVRDIEKELENKNNNISYTIYSITIAIFCIIAVCIGVAGFAFGAYFNKSKY